MPKPENGIKWIRNRALSSVSPAELPRSIVMIIRGEGTHLFIYLLNIFK